jgi:hypothetical protein
VLGSNKGSPWQSLSNRVALKKVESRHQSSVWCGSSFLV